MIELTEIKENGTRSKVLISIDQITAVEEHSDIDAEKVAIQCGQIGWLVDESYDQIKDLLLEDTDSNTEENTI